MVFRQLKWPQEDSEYTVTVTWAELAIYFVASTHCALQRDQSENLNLEQQARLLRAAAKRVAHICKAPIVPDFDDSRMVPILTSLGRATGLNSRPRFLQPAVVHKVLFEAAMHPDARAE